MDVAVTGATLTQLESYKSLLVARQEVSETTRVSRLLATTQRGNCIVSCSNCKDRWDTISKFVWRSSAVLGCRAVGMAHPDRAVTNSSFPAESGFIDAGRLWGRDCMGGSTGRGMPEPSVSDLRHEHQAPNVSDRNPTTHDSRLTFNRGRRVCLSGGWPHACETYV